VPPQDFSNAYNSNLSPVRGQNHGDRDFGNQGQNNGDQGGQGQGRVQVGDQQQQQARNNEDTSYLRAPGEYETGQKRKRGFTIPGRFESP
jgi:hypothetical protein